MPRVLPRPLRPKPDHHRVLALLASSRDGLTQTAVPKHGCTVEQIDELVSAGLATASTQRIPKGHRTIEVARVKITSEGRRALAASTAANSRSCLIASPSMPNGAQTAISDQLAN